MQFPPPPLFLYMRLQATGTRQDTSKVHVAKDVASREKGAVLRQHATGSGDSRPARATESSTEPLFGDPKLAAVVVAWPDLPASVRAAILAMATGLEHLKNSI